jgi:hypothetical protein
LQLPLQHSDDWAHVVPVGLQHVLAVPQVHAEQQSAPVAHAPPSREQPHACVPPLHTPPQQSVAVEHAPLVIQPHVCCELQTTPTQQSAPRVQLPPVVKQPHVWLVELHTPVQQSLSAVHDCPSGAQHLPNGQTPPLQQSPSSWQATPAATHPQMPVARLQMPLQQFPAATAQGCPSGWHVPQIIDVPVSRQIRPEPLQQSE